MHYEFKGMVLKTENAAKPYRQGSKWLIQQISQIPSDAVALDYGCGKFRYTIRLSRQVRHVVAVDSSFQIDRHQQIANTRTNLKDYARKHLKNVVVCETHSKMWQRIKFDFILCTNVLSVIPHRVERIDLLQNLAAALKPGGRMLVSTQFRNTYFKHLKTNRNAIWVRDGWFINGLRGASFYAIIPQKKLVSLCNAGGLSISQSGSKGETAFAFCY